MRPTLRSRAELVNLIHRRTHALGGPGLLALALGAVVLSVGVADAAARAGSSAPAAPLLQITAAPQQGAAQPPHTAEEPTWDGVDLDGDGAPDFANPTGRAPRGHDAFGDGCFHASRDGGTRPHEGVDYDSRAGQTVTAPISGFVSKIGYAYPGDARFKYVEIDNPALHIEARVFYVDPAVEVGNSVALGTPIGTAHSLQARYGGITDHIHLELAESGRKIDAQTVILARREDATMMAGMN